MAMTISELLSKVGDDHVQFQNLSQSMSNIQTRKNGDVAVTFHTGADKINPTSEVMGTGEWVGLVLWLPKQRVEAALNTETSKEA